MAAVPGLVPKYCKPEEQYPLFNINSANVDSVDILHKEIGQGAMERSGQTNSLC